MTKVLYLYAEVMGYTISTIRELVNKGAEVHIVYLDDKKLTPYCAPSMDNVYLYSKSELSRHQLMNLAEELQPDVTVVSGWVDKDYLRVAFSLKRSRRVVVCGLDGQWHGSLRQYVALMFGAFNLFHRFFSHAWVAGTYQYEYARKLRFLKKEIIFDLYSADTKKFMSSYAKSLSYKKSKYPHRFLFVGRLEPVKGLDILIEAWNRLGRGKKDWELHLIGNGSLKDKLSVVPGICVKDFMQPDELIAEIKEAGCFVLPSRIEPWGVVVHEFAAAGFPIIVSDVIGASALFVIDGMNGFKFSTSSAEQLMECLTKVISSSDVQLIEMGRISNQLAYRINAKTSAANLLSLVDRPDKNFT